ncbi:MAG: GNAT family N-acetyltransferase [Anaerolineaceae bacterium]|nr:GNAT family N-acetyltransferase [Anaerolineaceae bacterium]
MPDLPVDLSRSDVPRQIQQNLIAYMDLFSGLPNMVTYDADTYWFISKKPAPCDIILRANFSPENIEEKIDATFEAIGQHIDEIGWFVFPHDAPSDLGKRLEARGMTGGKGGNWLWADLTQLVDAPTVPDNFRIERVRDDEMMAVWTRISETGFENNDLRCFYDAYARHGYGDDAFSLHYIGYLDDTPVTSGTLLDAGGGATIYDLSTPPEFRGQGFGGALTYDLMRQIRERGYTDTWIWSSDMAQRLYRSLGFVDADFGLREYVWQK